MNNSVILVIATVLVIANVMRNLFKGSLDYPRSYPWFTRDDIVARDDFRINRGILGRLNLI